MDTKRLEDVVKTSIIGTRVSYKRIPGIVVQSHVHVGYETLEPTLFLVLRLTARLQYENDACNEVRFAVVDASDPQLYIIEDA